MASGSNAGRNDHFLAVRPFSRQRRQLVLRIVEDALQGFDDFRPALGVDVIMSGFDASLRLGVLGQIERSRVCAAGLPRRRGR